MRHYRPKDLVRCDAARLVPVVVDGFRKSNDAHGHVDGETVLTATAVPLNRAIRKPDAVTSVTDKFSDQSAVPGRIPVRIA